MSTKTRARSTWCRANDHVGCSTVKAVGCECACHGPVVAAKPGPKPGTVDRAAASTRAKRTWTRRRPEAHPRPTITKEQARCCQARLDKIGRPPIGYCSPTCERRP